jgi:hypothetical protein
MSQVKDACGGDLKRVKKVVKLVGFVNSENSFTDQPKVRNTAAAALAVCRSAIVSGASGWLTADCVPVHGCGGVN